MANGYQKHILIGNLGADPQTTTFDNGETVANFDIAVNEQNRDGTQVVTWYGISAWNGLGEASAQYLKKGRQVMVEGTRLRVEHWYGRDNNLYTKMELTANEVKFLGGNGNGASNGNGNGNGNGHYNGNGNGNRNSASKPRQPQRQPQHEPPRQPQHEPPRQPQRQPQHEPQRQPQHQPQHAPASRHQEEYFVPSNPDEIPF